MFSNTDRKIRANGDNVVTNFPFPFLIFLEGDLEVFKINTTTKVATLQTIVTDYTVNINASGEGGSIDYVLAPTATEESFIRYNIPETQLLDLFTGGNIPEENIENALDRMVKLVIELKEEQERSLLFTTTSTTKDILIPEPSSDKVWTWNNAGTALQLRTVAELLNLDDTFARSLNFSDVLDKPLAVKNLGIDPFKLQGAKFNFTDGQAVTNIPGFTLDSASRTSALYLVEIRKGVAPEIKFNNFLFWLQDFDGTWRGQLSLQSGEAINGTFTVTEAGGIAQVRYADGGGDGAGTIQFKECSFNV